MAPHTSTDPSSQVAELDLLARHHLQQRTPYDATVRDLKALDAAPEVVRAAAERARARYLSDPAAHWRDGDVARLLDDLL